MVSTEMPRPSQTSDQVLVMKAITVSLVKCEHFQSQTETKIRPKVRCVFNVVVSKTDHVYAKDELHTGHISREPALTVGFKQIREHQLRAVCSAVSR